MRGIDVFSGQGDINFQKVKEAGIEIIYIKATEGLTYINPRLESYYSGAKNVGLKIGFYHWLKANNPYAEAQHFLSTLSNFNADCKYVIDVEDTVFKYHVEDVSIRTRQICDYIKGVGKDPAIYASKNFYMENLNDTAKVYPLWVADYGVTSPNITNIGWQYSDSGQINGINTAVDLSEFSQGIFIGNTSNTPVQNITPSPDSNWWNGYNKIRTASLQTLLNGLGLRDENGNKLIVDGKAGTHTLKAAEKLPIAKIKGYHNDAYTDWLEVQLGQRADHYYAAIMDSIVRNFQKTHKLTVDGEVGLQTLKEILKQP